MSEDAIWAETTDGGLLKQLFGYYPTLHDALIRSVELRRDPDHLVILVDYTDLIELADRATGDELSARIRLEWRGIESFQMPLGEHGLMGLSFDRDEHNRIVTTFETWPGAFGRVVSESFEATLVQMDPGSPDAGAFFGYR